MFQNLTYAMRSGTIGGMKVLAVKDVEEYGNRWIVPYTRLTTRGVKQGAVFLCGTPEEARAKYHELVDILQHHNGVYVSKKAKKKVQSRRIRPAS
jgi:hypothetical protein